MRKAKSNLALAASLKNKEILIYNMTMDESTQILKLVMTLSETKDIFLAVVTTDSVPTHSDFTGTGNATVELFICVQNRKPVSEVFGVKCDSPGMMNETEQWTYLIDGKSISIIGRDKSVRENSTLVHVGCIALTYDNTKRYLKSRAKRSTEPRECLCQWPSNSFSFPQCTFVIVVRFR